MELPLTCDVCHKPVKPIDSGQTTAENVICVECLTRLQRQSLVQRNSMNPRFIAPRVPMEYRYDK